MATSKMNGGTAKFTGAKDPLPKVGSKMANVSSATRSIGKGGANRVGKGKA